MTDFYFFRKKSHSKLNSSEIYVSFQLQNAVHLFGLAKGLMYLHCHVQLKHSTYELLAYEFFFGGK